MKFTKTLYVVLAFAGCIASLKPALAQTLSLRMASAYPKELTSMHGVGVDVAKELSAIAALNAKVTAYAAFEITPPLGILDSTTNRSVDMGWINSGAYFMKDASFDVLSRPAFTTPTEFLQWRYSSVVEGLANKTYARLNVKGMPCAMVTGLSDLLVKRPTDNNIDISRLTDVAVSNGAAVRLYRAWTSQNIRYMGAGNLSRAMDMKNTQGALFMGPAEFEQLKMLESNRILLHPSDVRLFETIDLIINLDLWKSFTPNVQIAIETVCKEKVRATLVSSEQATNQTLSKLSKLGVQRLSMPAQSVEQAHKHYLNMLVNPMQPLSPEYKDLLASMPPLRVLQSRHQVAAAKLVPDFDKNETQATLSKMMKSMMGGINSMISGSASKMPDDKKAELNKVFELIGEATTEALVSPAVQNAYVQINQSTRDFVARQLARELSDNEMTEVDLLVRNPNFPKIQKLEAALGQLAVECMTSSLLPNLGNKNQTNEVPTDSVTSIRLINLIQNSGIFRTELPKNLEGAALGKSLLEESIKKCPYSTWEANANLLSKFADVEASYLQYAKQPIVQRLDIQIAKATQDMIVSGLPSLNTVMELAMKQAFTKIAPKIQALTTSPK